MNVISTFYDPLYGKLKFPSLITKCLASPEITRLKDIRLSNINCDQTPGLANTSRFEHIIGCTYLAYTFAKNNKFDERNLYELCIAAIYHDVATPPFGHSFELVLPDFNHEIETRNIIIGRDSKLWKSPYENQYFQGSYPKLSEIVSSYNRTVKHRLSLERIADYTIGKGKLGAIIKNDLDLDNLDNIIRAAFYSGIKVDKDLPLRIINKCKMDDSGFLVIPKHDMELIDAWKRTKYILYEMFLSNTHDLIKEIYLQNIFRLALNLNVLSHDDWGLSDRQIITKLIQDENTSLLYKKLETGRLPTLILEGWCLEKDYISWSGKKKNIENMVAAIKNELVKKESDCNFLYGVKKDRRFTKLNNVIFENIPYLFNKSKEQEVIDTQDRKYFIYILIDGNMPLKLDAQENPIMVSGQAVRMNKKEVVEIILSTFKEAGLILKTNYKIFDKEEIIFS